MTEQQAVEVRRPKPGDWHILEIRHETGEPGSYKIPFRLTPGVTGFYFYESSHRPPVEALAIEHNAEMELLRARIVDLENQLNGYTTVKVKSSVRPHPEWRHVSLPCGCRAGGVPSVGLIHEMCPTHFGKEETLEELKSLWAKAVKTGDA